MPARIKNPNHVFTGVFLILVALLAFWAAWPLSSRTDMGIGPGYVPKMLALALTALGGLLVASGMLHDGEPTAAWHPRPLVLILSSVAFFGLTIERLGVVVALTGLVLLGCAANRETRLHEAVALAVGSVLVAVFLFVKALGLTMPIWPAFLRG